MEELSDEWKSLFPINSNSFSSPLLLSSPSLGPLFLNPTYPSKLLFSSPLLFPPLLSLPPRLSLSRFLFTSSSLPLSTANHIASTTSLRDDAISSFLSCNRLQLICCADQKVAIAFFSTGSNHEEVGFLGIQVKDGSLEVLDDSSMGGFFVAKTQSGQMILKILVNPVDEFDGISANFSSEGVVGFLIAFTLYSIHWFCVKFDEKRRIPSVDFLCFKLFKTSSIVDACWSPHLPQESLVLLESGALFLFDLDSFFDSKSSSASLRGTRLSVPWEASTCLENCEWLGCQFSWHPRILMIARSDALFLVDRRAKECTITCLAKVEMLRMYSPYEEERFLAFSTACSDGFRFVLASKFMLLLGDIRKPLTPLLSWVHDLDTPCFIHVYSLSELRSSMKDYEFATGSGFCILLGSFWNCEFKLFCYGPPLPTLERSVPSEVSPASNPFFAWESPSCIFLSDKECICGTCLMREQFHRDDLPGWVDWQQKKEMVMGFAILGRDLSASLSDVEEFVDFTLVRLMSSGKLEAQRYRASSKPVTKFHEIFSPRSESDRSLLYSIGDEECGFPKKFKYLKLEYLKAHLNGKLTEVLDSRMKIVEKPDDITVEDSFSLEFHEILCKILSECGFSRFRSSPTISLVFNDIHMPTSICEVGMRRLWTSLPMELLELAFSRYSEFGNVLVDGKKVYLEFTDIPDLPQLPPFFLRKPTCRSNKWSDKLPPRDSLVGPVVPLPVLGTLDSLKNGCPTSQEEGSTFLPERELDLRCDEAMRIVKEMAFSETSNERHADEAVPLDEDRDEMWTNPQTSKPFFMYSPSASESSPPTDEKRSAVISKIRGKQEILSGENESSIGLEMFDDLCPIELKFETNNLEFGSIETYGSLKKQFLKWQKSFKPYRELCSRAKF